ncbi:hypothetical protein SLEP1_g38011 [Rubroshorea leprosula]|uniref:Integrase catalytic domain-containing protein n=1 Tax=Rubroshorea leprosula TaxID=152421 RepID=A0AAV5KWU6_9ROSI|nr:hypothetical protein SLEP1_g38011 [Rubroshorea leprosula]
MGLLDAGIGLKDGFQDDEVKDPIAHDVFSYVKSCVNSALQTVRYYALRMNSLKKIEEHSNILMDAVWMLDPNNLESVKGLAMEAVQYKNAKLEYTRKHQSGADRDYPKALLDGVDVAGLVGILRQLGDLADIVSDKDPRFTARFWRSFQKAMGTQLKLSTAYHPQTDGQSKRTIQVLEDMLRACALDLPESWDDHLPLVEFAYNNSYHSSIKMAPYEALYGRRCRTPICWAKVGYGRVMGPDFVQQTTEKVKLIQQRLKVAQDRQKSYADNRRRPLEWRLCIFEDEVAYRIALPPELSNVHNVFHVSVLRKYEPDPSHVINYEPLELKEDLSYTKQPIQILDRKEKVLRNKTVSLVKVLWRHHSENEATWELESQMRG